MQYPGEPDDRCGVKHMHYTERLSLRTEGFCDIRDITDGVLGIRERSNITEGLVTIFCPGSTGALTTIEYESGALHDLKGAIERLAPADGHYEHNERWGDGNGFSHVRAALMKPSLSIPVVDGALTLGTWQQIVFIDFDNRPRKRELVVQISGER